MPESVNWSITWAGKVADFESPMRPGKGSGFQ